MSLSLKTKEAEEFSKNEIFLVLQAYIQEQIELSQRKTLDEESFNKPSWSEYQAFQLGMQKAYNKLAVFIPNPDPEGN